MDIAIAGAGIAGLTAAILLRRMSHRVVLFDQLDAPAAVGSGLILQPTGQAVLGALGLLDEIASLGARIDRLYGRSVPSQRTVLDVRYRPLGENVSGIAIHRAALFGTLLKAAEQSGAEFEYGKVVKGVSDGVVEFASGERSATFDLVIDGLGVRSPLIPNTDKFLTYGALWANLAWPKDGFDPAALEQRYRKSYQMAGVLPIGRLASQESQLAAFFWSLRHDQFDHWQRQGLDAWKNEVIILWPELSPLLDQIADPQQLIFARYAHHTLNNPAQKKLAHIGDSYHAASPQLGQGANMAMLDAYALTLALRDTNSIGDALTNYASLRRGHVRLYQLMSWLFTPVYQSDSRILPWLRDMIAAPLSKAPPAPYVLASMVAGTIGDPLKKLQL